MKTWYNPVMIEKRHATDTSAAAERLQIELIRQLSPTERLRKTFAISNQMHSLCKAAIRRRHPEFSEDEVRVKFIEINYGTKLADNVRSWRKSRARA